MTLAISTSSPVASIALFDGTQLKGSRNGLADRRASELVLTWTQELFAEIGADFRVIDKLVVDHGPGSFTGVKVGVTIAKIWAYQFGISICAVDSFDLIDTKVPVAVPHKRGSLIVRHVGRQAIVTSVDDSEISGVVGYGIPGRVEKYPEAIRAMEAQNRWIESQAKTLTPNYVVEPSISTPKLPYASRAEGV